jgi:hypothetical protein
MDPDRGLMIREVDERPPVLLDAVSHRGSLVRDLARPNRRRADPHRFLGRVMERDVGRDVAQAHREQRR